MSENTIKSIDELLQMFVSTDEDRAKFMKPWRERNHVFATETHILICVNGYLTTADYPQYNSDNTNKLFPTGTPNGILTALTLENAISYAPLIDEMITVGEDVGCRECDGTGSVDWEYRHWTEPFDCPVCNGSGYMSRSKSEPSGRKVIDPYANVRIGLLSFKVSFLKLLLEAMRFCNCDECTVTFGGSRTATLFNLTDEIDIIIMPAYTEKWYTSISLSDIK